MSSDAEQKAVEQNDVSGLRSGHASGQHIGQPMEDVDDASALRSGHASALRSGPDESNKRKEYDDSASIEEHQAFKRRKTAPSAADGKDAKVPAKEDRYDKWRRPPVLAGLSNEADVHFMIMDIDVSSTESRLSEGKSTCAFTPATKHRPVFHVYGVTDKSHSICVTVHDFYPYLLIRAQDMSVDLVQFRAELEAYMQAATMGKKFAAELQGNRVLNVELETDHNDIMNYVAGQNAVPFIKITLCLPTLVPKCREILTTKSFFNGTTRFSITYESNVKFFLRFLINKRSSGCSWVTLPAGTFWHVAKPSTRSQIEVLTRHDTMVFHSYQEAEQWSRVCPLRVLSFDIECKSIKKGFPHPEESPVVMICTVLLMDDGQGRVTMQMVGFGWPDDYGSIATEDGIPLHFFGCKDERDMLRQWRDFLHAVDPDIITGYNIINFDLGYLIDRAKTLHVESSVAYGRKIGTICGYEEKTMQTKAFGQQKNKSILGMNGRVILDPLPVLKKQKFRSYTLDNMAWKLLKKRKVEVDHSQIPELHEKNATTRAHLAYYCFIDSLRALQIVLQQQMVPSLVEMCRITGVTIFLLLTSGQQIKGFTLILIEAGKAKFHVPTPPKSQTNEGKFDGAVVLEVVRGYYKGEPVAVLDFNSLYPSIMIALNLSYDTLLTAEQRKLMRPEDYNTSPDGKHAFVKKHIRQGLLSGVQAGLLKSRKMVKNLEAEEKDPSKKAILTARQTGIKLSGNSVYGFTGAKNGMFPCRAIAETVTGTGRHHILRVKKLLETHFTKANGYPYDSKVVGGDTDSVFITFGPVDMDTHARFAYEAQEMVNADLRAMSRGDMSIEHEKTYHNMLLVRRKGNASLLYKPKKLDKKKSALEPGNLTMVLEKEKDGKTDKIHETGLVSVRRDNCEWNSETNAECFDLIVHGKPDEAVALVKREMAELMSGKTDRSRLIISRGISKEHYDKPNTGTAMRKKLTERDEYAPTAWPTAYGTCIFCRTEAPRVGDRIQFVVVQGRKEQKLYERVEDPMYALLNDVPLDREYYRDNQLRKPIMTTFSIVLGSEAAAAALLDGPHTRQRLKVATA